MDEDLPLDFGELKSSTSQCSDLSDLNAANHAMNSRPSSSVSIGSSSSSSSSVSIAPTAPNSTPNSYVQLQDDAHIRDGMMSSTSSSPPRRSSNDGVDMEEDEDIYDTQYMMFSDDDDQLGGRGGALGGDPISAAVDSWFATATNGAWIDVSEIDNVSEIWPSRYLCKWAESGAATDIIKAPCWAPYSGLSFVAR